MFQGALGWATYQYGLQCSKQSSKAVLFRYAALGTLPMRCDDSDPLDDEFGCRIVVYTPYHQKKPRERAPVGVNGPGGCTTHAPRFAMLILEFD